jgi:hypothetical protein
LFFATNGAEITGVRLEAANITGKNNVGALVGSAINTLIDDCEAGGTVKGNTTVGGLVGRLYNGTNNTNMTLERCHSTGTVSGINYIGGLVGYAYLTNGGISLKESYSTGEVNGRDTIGGLLGRGGLSSAGSSNFLTIDKCYATGKIYASGGSRGVGGLVGAMTRINSGNFEINYCYATGSITAPNYQSAGGLVGFVQGENGKVMQCYSTGNVDAGDFPSNVKGFIGAIPTYSTGSGSAATIVSGCYYDKDKSGITDNNTGVTGLTTEEMGVKENYIGWNFSSTWGMDASKGYPYLQSLGETAEPMYKGRNFSNTSVGSAVPRAIVVGRQLVLSGMGGLSGVGVRFYDLRGRLVWSYAARGSGKVSLGKVPSGRYIMELREGKSRLSVSRVSVR